ncbi:MAG: hypothetical protein JJU26_06405 [Oceanicaulis sp.]|nr:hypothetical protein [Oceanicaulis sp.]
MLVSHNKKFIFLKTKKTAGTSVEFALQRYCVPPRIETKHHTPEMETEYGIVGRRGRAYNGPHVIWYNHMPALELKNLVPIDVWSGYRRICTIRNPWDQVVSAFHFFNKLKGSEPKDLKIHMFRIWAKNSMADKMADDQLIYSIDGEPVIDTYIVQSRIKTDFEQLCRKIGVPNSQLPRLKSEYRGNFIPYMDYYDSQSIEAVAEVFAKPIEWFGWRFDVAAPDRLPPPADRLHLID